MMSRRRRALTYSMFGLAALLVALAAGAVPRLRQRHVTLPPPPPPVQPVAQTPVTPPTPPPQQQQPPPPEVPQVEVVFALDTTSSMSGLIDGAKRKIWSLVNFISSAQPTPHVRIGLVAYRDRGDDYVTRVYDLSDDLDEVFQHLMKLRADGGGDTPEDVGRGLHDAIAKQSWTQGTQGEKVARIIYLVGDAPPHFDYEDGYNIDSLARRAADKGIHVNTIRCGDDAETATSFRRIARLGHGQFATVDQSGGVAEIATPYDAKLAELNKKLLSTTIAYGHGAGAMRAKVAAAAAAPMAAAADRAAFASTTGGAVSGEGDLIGRLGTLGKGAGGLKEIPAAELPAELAALTLAEREKVVADKLAERKRVMDEIRDLSSKRSAAMVKAKAARPARADGFDDHVMKSLKEETAGMLSF